MGLTMKVIANTRCAVSAVEPMDAHRASSKITKAQTGDNPDIERAALANLAPNKIDSTLR